MLIINFKNNIPQQNHYSFSVVGNNKSNKIKFVLDRYQDEVDLSEFSAYVKVMADGGDFVDIMPLSHSIVGSEIEIVWELKRKTTQFSIVECQLSFKKTANDEDIIVWQSAIFGIELLKSINAEEEIPDLMPSVIEEMQDELADHEERIEALEEGQGINEIVVGNPSDYVNENGIKKLIRKEDEQGGIHETYVIDKDHIPHEMVDSAPTSTNNGTQLNNSAKVKDDLSRYEDVFGSAVIEPLNNAIYTAYYNKNDEITKAIRIGVASRYGALEITGLAPNKEIKLTIGGYFRYDENDEKVFDSNCYLYIEDKNHEGNFFELTEETQEFDLVADDNGRIYLSNDASSIVEEGEVFGRLFVYGFEGEVAEHTEYHAKQLAKKEDIEEVQQEVVETNERVGQAEDRIGNNEEDIADLQDEIAKIGDVQIFDRTSLPTPSAQYLKKIFRVNGVLFQCVKVGDSLDETFDFDNVSGTSEVNADGFDSFAQQVGESFAENIELYGEPQWLVFTPVQIIQSDEKYYDVNSFLDLSGLTFFTTAELSNCDIDAIWNTEGYAWQVEPLPDYSGIQQIEYLSNTVLSIVSNDGNTYVAESDEDDDKMLITIYNANSQLFNSAVLPYLREEQFVQPVAKLFRNNGDIRLGNSSTAGQFIFSDKNFIGGFREVSVELQAWSSTKSSAVKMSMGSSTASVVIPKGETRTLTITDNNGADKFALTTEKVGNQDPRVIIKSMYIRMGEASYEWKAVGGGVSESLGNVEIEKVWLTYDDKRSIVANYLGMYDDELGNFINDSTRIWVNFKTTPISSGVEEEIKKGRFIIRLDYPIRGHKGFSPDKIVKHQPSGDYGYGYKSFVRNFDSELTSAGKIAFLKNTFIYIRPEDIVSNRYGEKYIHKKISYFEYLNKTCSLDTPLYPLTIDEINNTEEGRNLFADFIIDVFSCGIPQTQMNGSVFDNGHLSHNFKGIAKLKYSQSVNGYTLAISNKNAFNLKKLNPAFSCYSLFKTNFGEEDHKTLSTHYLATHHKKDLNYCYMVDTYVLARYNNGIWECQNQLLNDHSYMSAKPRCAILSDNWETSEHAFLKLFPQATQNIRTYCKCMRYIDEYGYDILPIFRMLITNKS